MEFNQVYFYTATIKDWIPILKSDRRKSIVIDSLKYLTSKGLIKLYAFVIMPNHIHLIWELKRMNGKEKPDASFKKFTSHQILQDLNQTNPDILSKFESLRSDRTFEIWQYKSMAVHVYSPSVIFQKLDYVHTNPVQGKWNLADDFVSYQFSSARFYETLEDHWGILTHIQDRI